MEIAVAILESKNLSHSAIITRNLFTSLQVGAVVQKGKHVEQDDVRFAVSDGEAPLVVSVANGQTQTVLYERDVPLSVVLGRSGAGSFALWVAVFPPGDQRNFAPFDEGAVPRADLPQVHLRLARTAGDRLSVPLQMPDEPRMSLGALPSPLSPDVPGRARQLEENNTAQDAVARATALLASLGASRTASGDGPRESIGPRDSMRSDAPRPSLLRDLSPVDRALASPRRPPVEQKRAQTMMGGLASLEEMNRPSITSDARPQRQTMLNQKDLLALRVCDVQATEVRGGLAALKSQGADLQSKEKEVQEAISAVEDTRAAIKQAEADLSAEICSRAELERDKQDAREHCAEARDHVRLRDLALVELRQARDDAEERLAQLQAQGGSSGAGDLGEELGRLEAGADSELQSLAEALESLRAEAEGLQGQLATCDDKRQALEAEPTGVAPSTDAPDLRELRREADAAQAELEGVRQRAEEQAARVDGARAQSEAARQRLVDTEAAAEAAKRALAERETAAADKEKMEHMGRAAQLEGQVGENDNQLSEMQRQVQELVSHTKAKDDEVQSLEETISGIKAEMEVVTKDAEQNVHASTSADALLKQITAEATEQQSRLSALELSRRADDLDHTQRVDSHDATAAAVDSELREAQREAMRLINEQEKHKAEAQSAEGESASCAKQLEEARARALALEQELAVANVDRARHEQHRTAEERRMGDLDAELQEALRKLEAADTEVSSARAEAAASHPGRSSKEEQIEEQLRKIRTELELQLPQVEDAERRRTCTVEELEEHRRQLPLRRERAKELMAEEQRLEDERQKIRDAMEQTRRCTGEQREAADRLQAKIAELDSHVGSAAEDASSGEKEQHGRQQKHDEERKSWAERIGLGHSDLEDSRRATAGADEQLGLLRAQCAKVAEQQAAAQSAVSEAAERLVAAQHAVEGQAGTSGSQLAAAEEDVARCEAEEAALKVRAAGLDAQLAQLEERCTKELRGYRDLSSEFDGQRKKLLEAQAALEGCNGELLSFQNQHQASAGSLGSSREQASMLQARAAELRQQLASLQEAVNHAERLRAVLDAAKDTHEASREDMQKAFEQKEAELDAVAKKEKADEDDRRDAEAEKRVARIAELEAALKVLEDLLERAAAEKEAVSSRLGEMAVDKVGDQVVARLTALQKELQGAEERRWQLEAKITTIKAKTGASEDVIRTCERELADRNKQLEEVNSESDKFRQARDQQMQVLAVEVAAADKDRLAVESQKAQLMAETAEAKEGRDASQGQLKDRERRREESEQDISKTHLDLTVAEAEQRVTLDQSSRLQAESEEMDNSEDEELETKVKLLSEQLTSLREALANAIGDSPAASDDGLPGSELEQCRAQLQTATDKLAAQVEHGNVLFFTSKDLEEEIRTLEGESDVLTLGFHDAQQQSDGLQKENLLMKQQVEGAYEGTQQDWATEVQRLKVEVEVKRHQDELSHWKQQALDYEREQCRDASAVAPVQEESPDTAALRRKLDAATEELALQESRLRALGPELPDSGEASGSVHSVPAALHGLVAPAMPLPARALRRKALIVACSYADSHVPLRGCGNDAWNMQCLLRHSLQYAEEQVRCLVGDSEFCPSPPQRRPTRENILTGFDWLSSGAVPGDNLLVFFCGYGTQQPQSVRGLPEGREALLESHLVPDDFAEDLPAGFLSDPGFCSPSMAGAAGPRYRLVPLVALRNSLARVPAGCKVTLVLDCGSSVVPGVGPHAAPAAFPRPRDQRRQVVAPLGRIPFVSQAREIDLPPLPTIATPIIPGNLECIVHCYSACQSRQWCAELPIEGAVQGAFTWAFVKALTHGHLCSTVRQHLRAMDKILADLKHYFKWVDQTPVLQLSGSAGPDDVVLVSP